MIKHIFTIMLLLSGVALAVSAVLASVYEGFAPIVGVPFISDIVTPWIKTHNFVASLLVGAVVGFLTFLVLHFFGAKA